MVQETQTLNVQHTLFICSHQECHCLRTDVIPPLSCAVEFIFKNAALATSGLLPVTTLNLYLILSVGFGFSLCLMWWLPTSLQRLVYQYVSTLTDSLSMCPKTSFGFIMGTCRTYSVFIIDMAPCSCSSGDSCRAGTLFFMPGQEGLVPPPSPLASPCLLHL